MDETRAFGISLVCNVSLDKRKKDVSLSVTGDTRGIVSFTILTPC